MSVPDDDAADPETLPPLFRQKFTWTSVVSLVLGVAALIAMQRLTRWNLALEIGLMLVIQVAVQVGFLFARDVRPRPVPPQLTAGIERLMAGGWRMTRWHPWLCDERAPHVHMVAGDAKHTKTLVRLAQDGTDRRVTS